MKLRAPHAINQFVDGNQTIELYRKLSEDYNRYKFSPRVHKSYNFKVRGAPVSLTVLGNFIYGSAVRYLRRYLNGQRESFHENHDIEVCSPSHWQQLQLYTIIRVDITGVWCHIHGCPFSAKGGPFIFRVNTHQPLDSNQVLKITKSAVESLLYPQGFLRDIQLSKRCPKADVKQWYKLLRTNNGRIRDATGYDYTKCHRAMLRRLRKKYNILLTNSHPDNMQVDYKNAIRTGRNRKLSIVNARSWHISYSDLEDWCYGEGCELDEDTVIQAYDELLTE